MSKIKAIEAIYNFYDKFLEGFPIVCQKGCSVCCTTNVSVTSLEVEYLIDLLDEEKIARLKEAKNKKYFIPSTTINTSASMCLAGNEPPPEAEEMTNDPCPLLSEKGLCTIYEKRPFACRAMVSETVCPEGGQAYMAPFLVTVNLAIYQILEHIDSSGCYGNLLDLIEICEEPPERRMFKIKELKGKVKTNRQLPCFIIPPEETIRFKSFMRRLSKEKVEGEQTLEYYLPKKWTIIS